jgi:hypothetical protein
VERTEHPDMNLHHQLHLNFVKGAKIYHGEKRASFTNLLGKLDICMQKAEARSMSFTLCEYQLNVD